MDQIGYKPEQDIEWIGNLAITLKDPVLGASDPSYGYPHSKMEIG